MDPVSLIALGVCAAWLARPVSVTPRAAAVVGGLATMAPDMDAWLLLWDGPAAYMLHRGGVTHAIWMVPVWSGLAAWVVHWRSGASFIGLWRCGLAATLSHLVIELLTLQGVAPLAPLSDTYRGLALLHTVDLVFIACALLPWWLPALRRRAHRVRGLVGMVSCATVVVIGGVTHGAAMAHGRSMASALGLPASATVHVWPRPWLTTARNIFVVDAGLAYHASYDLFDSSDGFGAIIALNDSDPSVRAMEVAPHMEQMRARGALLHAAIQRLPQPRKLNVLVSDLRYLSDSWGNFAPRLFAATRLTPEGAEVIEGRWVWGGEHLPEMKQAGALTP